MKVDLGELRQLEVRLAAGELPAESLPLLLATVRHALRCGHVRRRASSTTERRRPRRRAAPHKRKGHGRTAARDYPGAERVPVAHPSQKVGDRCPQCGRGRLYAMESSDHIELTAAPPVRATRFECEVLRCSACQTTSTAPLPAEASGEKYPPRVDAVLAVTRFQMGVPHNRLAQWQGWSGVPLAPSTQFERLEVMADRVFPVFQTMERMAANLPLVHSDDTGARILELQQENRTREGKERTGIFTTVMIASGLGRATPTIVLYASGRRHAGENLDDLLRSRSPAMGDVIHMADASSRAPRFESVIDARCLTHARRYYIEAEPAFPELCGHVLDELALVYRNDADTRAMDPDERLRHHQMHSAPVMERLYAWIEEQGDQRTVEPNSLLGKAFRYTRNHWEGLTRFLKVPGVPLDNTLSERELKPSLRHRKNSIFFKTRAGAAIGDVLMSIIRTCVANRVDPVHYLETIGTHAAAARASPEDWLPWTYAATLNKTGHQLTRRQGSAMPARSGNPL